MRRYGRFIGAVIAATFALASGCPLNTFAVRIINEADGANVLALYLDNSATQGEGSGNYLSPPIAPGESRTVKIPLDDVDAAGADALYIGGAEAGGQIVQLETATIPVTFSAGGRITITMSGASGMLEFNW
jgi:hypothetical protein